ncbi:kinetochore-associated Ndc80 complex subunit ndc80 [Phytophthora boehmeriae]|uniref:Kinetochore protein NDC80 n=1 Tax=Phytophthora boehmeriae TaxID=109152 RepID=A0A8T1XAD1_9STRA|nr:kinetochore-associated Ndc80 complex subunit ndc80 [Phytophthora boehmeriae]
MRRTTLGPVSSSQLNTRSSMLRHPSSRVSVGAGKSVMERQSIGAISRRVSTASHTARRPPAGPRSSMNARQSVGNAAGSGRRSSTYGSRASVSGRGGSRILDPRPVSDKSYLNSCVQTLVEFLSDRMYDQTLSPGLLKRGPSKKDFCNMILFLFKQVDPTFEFGVKFEEDVVVQFRNLRYPIPISKTSLAAVGTPHTWPTLLLSISWLIELLSYDEAIQQNELEQTEDEEENGDKQFFKYLDASYHVFLAGEDDKFSALETQERQKLIARNEIVKEETNELELQRDELRKRIEKAKNNKSALSELSKKKADCEGDFEKFKKLVSDLEKLQLKLNNKIESLGEAQQSCEEELNAAQQEIQRLHIRIENQELSAFDIEQIGQERARLTDQLHQVTDRHNLVQSQIQNEENRAAAKRDFLDDKIDEYLAVCRRLKLLPTTAKNALGFDYMVQLDPTLAELPAVHELTQHLKTKVRKAALGLKQNRIERGNAALDEVLLLQDQMQQCEDRLRAESQSEQVGEDKVKKTTEAIRKDRQAREEAINRKVAATEEVELQMAEISSKRNIVDEERVSKERLVQLRKSAGEMADKYQALLDKNRHAVTNVLVGCTNHKSMVDQAISSLETEIWKLDL